MSLMSTELLVTPQEYLEAGFDDGGDSASLSAVLLNSQRLIDILTSGKCSQILGSEQTDHLKFAICLQTEAALTGKLTDGYEKFTIGDFSIEPADGKPKEAIDRAALAVLRASGLMYAGVAA